jgi:glycosyltransferase involved in cell wall biosynthesis
MAHPFFSITIPTYNRCDLLTYAIRSILKQTFDDFEIVVSDNHSVDRTERTVKEFDDPRVRYVKPPRHLVTVDSFEFARSNAKGKLVIVLNDDDVLTAGALERFARESETYHADLLFSNNAEYRDRGFPGPERNTLDVTAFHGPSRLVTREEFLKPAFACRLTFNQHPSAFVFSRVLAESITNKCGRFFQSNGVEYCAWPLAAAFARNIVHIDAPLAICGRTGKSWGSNLVLGRAKKKQIQKLIDIYYVDQRYHCVPLKNFTMCNLRAEGILAAKRLFPKEFAAYEFDEIKYLKDTIAELRHRQTLGVDVSTEMDELKRYLDKYPPMKEKLVREDESIARAREANPWIRLRGKIGDMGLRQLRDRLEAHRLAKGRLSRDAEKVHRGDVRTGFRISGADFGFRDIVAAADFLSTIMTAHGAQCAAMASAATGPGRVDAPHLTKPATTSS